jgi:hypothetical protein
MRVTSRAIAGVAAFILPFSASEAASMGRDARADVLLHHQHRQGRDARTSAASTARTRTECSSPRHRERPLPPSRGSGART